MSLFPFVNSQKASREQSTSSAAPYRSTRSSARATAPEAVLRGLAPDGGLYVDPEIASGGFDVQSCLALDPFGQAERILTRLLPGFEDMQTLVRRAYAGRFASDELTPLVPVGEDYVLDNNGLQQRKIAYSFHQALLGNYIGNDSR